MNLHLIARIFLCIVFLFYGKLLFSQYYILGRGLDEQEQPYAFATAQLRGDDFFSEQKCSELGVFRFENLNPGKYELVLITAYGIRRKKIDLQGSIDVTLHIPRNIQIEEISVIARRSGSTEPVTHDDISSEELKKKDFGQDMPYLLEGSPSLVTTSDAGHGIGYTGLRIRGTDPTRINVTLNGIPVNDAESHNVFWVDLPDLVSSTTTVQVNRGLGWSQPGVGDFGGGIQINTLAFNYEPYVHAQVGGGSFETSRATLTAGSGLINGRFILDGRGSYIHSGGYIDRAESNLYSFYGSAGYHHDQSNLRLIYTLGDEVTYQCWNGVPEQYINDSQLRTYNSAGTEKEGTPYENEIDDYRQSHLQLHFDQSLTPFARWTTALHYTKGKGYFEQYKADQLTTVYNLPEIADTTDLIRRLWLDNDFYGFTSTIQIGSPAERYLVLGGGWNKYLGDHYGTVIWTEEKGDIVDDHVYDFNSAEKTDWNIFGRSNLKITNHLDATVDLQGRWIHYQFVGPDQSGALTDQLVKHNFFNPKVGFRYRLSGNHSIYALSGIIHKEPNRDDYVNSTPLSRPLPEKLLDYEIGYRNSGTKFGFELTGYYMDYTDHLVLTGRLNDVGAYTRVNVDKSHRTGIEAIISYKPVNKLSFELQATFSENKIEAFNEYIDNWDTGEQEVVSHMNTQIAFSPNTLANLKVGYQLISTQTHEISFDLAGNYVGKQFVDNTSLEASSLDSYLVSDLGIHWTWHATWSKEFKLSLLVRNVLDQQYESNGWIYRFISEDFDPRSTDPYSGLENDSQYHQKGYFPQAGRNIYVNLSLAF